MRGNDKHGFTYVELLITLAIMAMLFLPLMQLFSHALASTRDSLDAVTAVNLAKWRMEMLKNLNLSKQGYKQLSGDVYPPITEAPLSLNGIHWRVRMDAGKAPEGDPLEVSVQVLRENEVQPVITLVTLIEDTTWLTPKA